MDLFAPLKRALAEQNYVNPTPIQLQTIPPAVDGQDILGCAQTGTGKTAAFALPILDFLGHDQPKTKPHRPTALVLAPTRELAIQISESFDVYGKYVKFSQALVYGGVSQHTQVKQLQRGVDVLIATPGRLLDLMQQGHIQLDNIQIFVLDEADRMLDMGFLPALRSIIAKLPEDRQSMFFSATMPSKTRQLSNQLLFNPVSVNVIPTASPSVELIEQSVWMLNRDGKVKSLIELLNGHAVDRTIVFTRTKRGANQLTRKLDQAGISAVAIHGNKTQNARQKALTAFRDNRVSVLVATDVAARGIDIDGVTHVVNYDMPVEAESYVHRIGRTGRAGADGVAVSFCTPAERPELLAIEKLLGKRLQIDHQQSASASQLSQNSVSGKSGRSSAARNKKPATQNPNQQRSRRRNGNQTKTTKAQLATR